MALKMLGPNDPTNIYETRNWGSKFLRIKKQPQIAFYTLKFFRSKSKKIPLMALKMLGPKDPTKIHETRNWGSKFLRNKKQAKND